MIKKSVAARLDLFFIVIYLAASAPLYAQTDEQILPEVKVQATPAPETAYGPDEGYVAERSATATKTDTPLIETPQSVTVITRERIEDMGAQGIQDALNYAAGVRSDAFGLDSRTDSVYIRGAFPDEYLDGLRQLFGFYTSTTRTDPYMLERIEVLRGPAAMLYGQGSTAGIVNLVSKRPLDEIRREVGIQLGSFNRKQLQSDLTGPLTDDGKWLYRLIALGRSDTQVDFVDDDRALLAPSLTWRPSNDTSLTLQLRYQKDKSGSTLQFFPWSGTVLPNPNGRIPTERFIGEPGFDRYDSERLTAGYLFEHRFNENWSVHQNLRVTRNENDYRTLYSDSFTSPGNSFIDAEQRVLDRFAQSGITDVRLLTIDQHVQGKISTGRLQHQLLLGLDIVRFTQTGQSFFDSPISQGGTVPPIDVFNPVYSGYTADALAEDPESTQRQEGVYLQDQMKFGANWIVVGGLRHDRARSGLEGGDTESSNATTKRLGLLYAFDNGVSPYVSYSESFTPVAGTNLAGQRFDPMRGKQVEAGVKLQPEGKGYSFTAALFELRESNRLVSDPSDPLSQIQAGENETNGLELEWLGRIGRRAEISAHYNYINNDKELDAMPAHQAAIWSKYRFSILDVTGFSAGLGVRYFSSFTDKTAPTTPSVALADVLLAWESERWRYALNVQNLTDKDYVSTCLPRGDCFFGARRTVLGTATFRF